MTTKPDHDQSLRREVRESYAKIARGDQGPRAGRQDGCGCCGGEAAAPVSLRLGYDPAQLERLPEGVDLGLSCGNPTALASLRPGEVVLDLGSGAGFDCFVAGPLVGAAGRVIGVDMTPEMVERARAALGAYRDRTDLENVEFRLGEIEHLPVADASVDVVVSNCVINLSTDKARVWREIHRVLKPGGRVSVSDVGLLRPLPAAVREDVLSWSGCVAGALPLEETRALLEAAGLVEVELRPRGDYVRGLREFGDPLVGSIESHLEPGLTVADLLTSVEVTARRPVDR